MANSINVDAVGLLIVHKGPKSPSTYDVAFLEKGRLDHPDDHPGEFVVGFAIGEGNPLSQGDGFAQQSPAQVTEVAKQPQD